MRQARGHMLVASAKTNDLSILVSMKLDNRVEPNGRQFVDVKDAIG
jgi:hypothetical protein